MNHSRLRLTLPVLLVTAGLAASGCGSSDDGGDEAAYVKTYETACKTITAQGKAFEAETAKLATTADADPAAAAATLKAGATKLFTTTGEQIQVMADADAPKKFADFQKSVKASADKAKETVAQANAAVAGVKSLEDFGNLGDKIGELKISGGDKLPADLAKQAPACKGLDS